MLESQAFCFSAEGGLFRPAGDTARRTVHGRFGELEVSPAAALHLEGGMLGFPQERYYCLVDYPGREHFKLLQSVSFDDLCFIVLPLSPENDFHQAADIEKAAAAVGYGREGLLLLLPVSSSLMDGVRRITANVRAPVFVDAKARHARQIVLSEPRYPMRAPL